MPIMVRVKSKEALNYKGKTYKYGDEIVMGYSEAQQMAFEKKVYFVSDFSNSLVPKLEKR